MISSTVIRTERAVEIVVATGFTWPAVPALLSPLAAPESALAGFLQCPDILNRFTYIAERAGERVGGIGFHLAGDATRNFSAGRYRVGYSRDLQMSGVRE